MAKRFTDTEKWKRPWYRSLPLQAKVVWQYLCDECDHAGIWIADFDLLTFQVGFKVDEEKLKEWLGTKLVRLDRDKYFIPSFFEFQYGTADKMFKAKVSALNRLAEFGIVDESGTFKDLTNSYLSLTEVSKDTYGIGKGKSKSIRGSAEGETSDALAALYRDYPRKEGKSGGMKRLARDLKAGATLDELNRALQRFVEHHRKKGTEKNYLPHFSTWTSEWRDWLEDDHGHSEDFAAEQGGSVDWTRFEGLPEQGL